VVSFSIHTGTDVIFLKYFYIPQKMISIADWVDVL
jgi:hypothetical protein